MKLLKNNTRMLFADILLLAILIASVALVSVFCQAKTAIYNDSIYDMNNGWIGEDGEDYSLDSLPEGDITLTHSLKGINLHRMRLCFESADVRVTAEFDGEKSYEYSPEQAAILGRSYGRYVHLIPIPPAAETVTLKLSPIYDGEAAAIRRPAVEDAGVFISETYRIGLPRFFICAGIALFGFLMIVIGFADKITDDSSINFFSLGAFAILVGVWSSNDTMVPQVYTMHPELVSFTRYLCMIFIVYLPVSFMASSTNRRKTILLPILLSLVAVNFTLTMTLSALKISDAHLMLPFSHVNIVIALAMTIYLMISGVRSKDVDKSFTYTAVAAMTFATIGVASDLLRYIATDGRLNDTSLCTRIGALFFVSLLGVHLIRKRSKLAIKRERAEVMEKMAYSDSLTGLANRAAFHEKEDEIREEGLGCIIVQLDVNYLKKVNDEHGHAAGDRHIIEAAKLIRQGFDGLGVAYRTGGDEFIVIAESCGVQEVEEAIKRIEEAEKAYNDENSPPVPLQLAYGYARYDREGSLEEAERLADQLMYERKRDMKALAVIEA